MSKKPEMTEEEFRTAATAFFESGLQTALDLAHIFEELQLPGIYPAPWASRYAHPSVAANTWEKIQALLQKIIHEEILDYYRKDASRSVANTRDPTNRDWLFDYVVQNERQPTTAESEAKKGRDHMLELIAGELADLHTNALGGGFIDKAHIERVKLPKALLLSPQQMADIAANEVCRHLRQLLEAYDQRRNPETVAKAFYGWAGQLTETKGQAFNPRSLWRYLRAANAPERPPGELPLAKDLLSSTSLTTPRKKNGLGD